MPKKSKRPVGRPPKKNKDKVAELKARLRMLEKAIAKFDHDHSGMPGGSLSKKKK